MRLTREFRSAWQRGKHHHLRHFIVIICPNQTKKARLGVTVSRKVGHAVRRNQLKRWLREFFRHNLSLLPASCDYSIVARTRAANLSHREMVSELSEFFSQLESGGHARQGGNKAY